METKQLKIGKAGIICDAVAVGISLIVLLSMALTAREYGYSFGDLWRQNAELILTFAVLSFLGTIDMILNILKLKTGVRLDENGVTVKYTKRFKFITERYAYTVITGATSEQKLNEKIWRYGTLKLGLKNGKTVRIRQTVKPWEYARWFNEVLNAKAAPKPEEKV